MMTNEEVKKHIETEVSGICNDIIDLYCDIRKLDGTKLSAGVSCKKLKFLETRRTYLIERRSGDSSPV